MSLQRVNLFLVVLLLILPVSVFSQQQMPPFAQKIPHVPCIDTGHSHLQMFSSNFAGVPGLRIIPILNINAPGTIRPGEYRTQLGFFCRQEVEFEKLTTVPLRLRLGSLDYVNKMEGKDICR